MVDSCVMEIVSMLFDVEGAELAVSEVLILPFGDMVMLVEEFSGAAVLVSDGLLVVPLVEVVLCEDELSAVVSDTTRLVVDDSASLKSCNRMLSKATTFMLESRFLSEVLVQSKAIFRIPFGLGLT